MFIIKVVVVIFSNKVNGCDTFIVINVLGRYLRGAAYPLKD